MCNCRNVTVLKGDKGDVGPQGPAGYKVYTALLTQASTSTPSAVVLQNTLSGTPSWSRVSVGRYRLTLSGEFLVNKVACFLGTILASGVEYTSARQDDNTFDLYTADGSVLTDELLDLTTFEIRVYP
jgi:hypothetical protein